MLRQKGRINEEPSGLSYMFGVVYLYYKIIFLKIAQ